MSPSTGAALKNLCAVFSIGESSTRPAPDVALQALLHLFGMPLVRAHGTRRQYGNGILAETGRTFAVNSSFVGQVGTVVVMMQEFPYFFANLNKSNAALISTYKSIATRNYILEVTGAVGGMSAISAGVGEGIRKGSVRAGAEKTLGRAVGRGPIAEAVIERLSPRVPKPAVGAVMIAAIVGANIAYQSGKQQMAEIRNILTHRFQSDKLTRAEYVSAFGPEVDVLAIKKYWEYR